LGTTIKDIAKETGLGLATISKYINGGNVLEKNKVAIEKAIKELDYTVNEFGRSLKTKKSMTVGIVIPELSNIFVTNIITIIEDILRKKGYSIIVCDCRTDQKLEKEVVDFLIRKRIDGLIIMPVSENGEFLNKVVVKKIPIVLIDRILEGLDADVVMVDNISASEKATKNLVNNGHTKIGIIVGPEEISTSRQRLIGYKNVLKSADITIKDELIAYGDYTVQGGYEKMKHLLKTNKNMTATFVTNYEMTLGAIIAINEMNVKIPDDLSFIGFDNLELSRVIKPNLSIVDQPLSEIGQSVAKTILKRLAEEQSTAKTKIELMTTLIERDSVKSV